MHRLLHRSHRRLAAAAGVLLVAAAAVVGLPPPAGATGNVFLVAGGGSGPQEGGQATSAALKNPSAIALTPDGGFVFSDQNGYQIRRVAPNGVVTTIAGDGTPCTTAGAVCGDGGGATSAQLGYPAGLRITPSGGVLFADSIANRIRLISSYTGGTISTVAGTGARGFSGDGGPAQSATFDQPVDVEILPDGSYLVSDAFNHRIRRVTALAGGTILTIAGSGVTGCCTTPFGGDGGPATAAGLGYPAGLAATRDGGVLFADNTNNRVRRLSNATTGGTITTVAGDGTYAVRGDGLPAANASFQGPWAVAVTPDGGYLVGGDSGVRRVDPQGRITTVLGGGTVTNPPNGTAGTSINAAGSYVEGITATTGGGFYVADRNHSRIYYVDGDYTSGTAGPPGAAGAVGATGPAGRDGTSVRVTCTTGAKKTKKGAKTTKGGKKMPTTVCTVQTTAPGAVVRVSAARHGRVVASAEIRLEGTTGRLTLGPRALRHTTYRLAIVVEADGQRVVTEQSLDLR